MRGFGFLYRKEELPEEIEVSAKSLSSWFAEVESEELSEATSEASEICDKIISDITSVGERTEELGEALVEENELTKPFLPTIQASQKTLTRKLITITSSLDLPEVSGFWDSVKFRDTVLNSMKQMDSAFYTHGRVVSRYLKTELKVLAAATKQLRNDMNRLEDFIKSNLDGAKLLKNARSGIEHLNNLQITVKEDRNKMKEVSHNLAKANADLRALQSKRDELKSKKEFRKTQDTIVEIKELEGKISKLGIELSNMFSKLARPFHKYEYTAGLRKDLKNLFESYLKNPLDAVRADPRLTILEALGKLSGGIQSGRIQLKDSDKVLKRIEDVTSELSVFQEHVQKLDSELKEKRSGLEGSVLKQQRDVELELVEAREAVNLKERERQNLEDAVSRRASSIRESTSDLERILEEALGKKITVTRR